MGNTVRSTKQFKGTFFKRLIRESLIFSCLNKFSDRFVKFFSGSIFYLIFCGSDETDIFFKNGFIGRIFSKINTEKRLIRPAKVFISNGVEKSHIVKYYRRIINMLLSAAIRFYGILFCIIGVYGTGIYLAKKFSYITTIPNDNELIWSAILIIIGTPMLFSGKSLVTTLKVSRFFRLVFINILGINEMYLKEQKKPQSYGTFAFVLGTILGVSTIFISLSSIILSILITVLCATVLFAPEFGLLLTILLYPLASVKLLAILLISSSISFILKVLRAKRNLRFKTADIFVLLFMLYIIAVGLFSGNGGQVRALYLVCYLFVYFLISNLIVSEQLIRKSLYSVCLGAVAGCLLFILHHITSDSDNIFLDSLLYSLDSSLINIDSFGYFLVMLIPICLALFKIRKRRSEKAGLLVLIVMTVVCIIIKEDSIIFTSAFIAVFIYSVFAFKKPITIFAIFAFIFWAVYFLLPFIPFMNKIYIINSVNAVNNDIGRLIFTFLLSGIGMGDQMLISGLNRIGANNNINSLGLYEKLLTQGGIFFLAVFVLAVFFILQRVFYCNFKCNNIKINYISAAFTAVIIMFLILGIGYDMWEYLRIYMLFWIVCGMVSAIKNVHERSVYLREGNTSDEGI
ncbi:MAG: hypothetical protein A2Y15_07925 [Clostridiales bacterium GWF2_36_10]|nr:MAG: hypothetical protein A2Y15_07925 [Clostridiales bacterium GWF2_36_10]HAN20273.1 hypothetical protein [Clostridiales bacterium]